MCTENMTNSKELQDVIKAIHKWANKNKDNGCFIAEFVSFKDDDKIKGKKVKDMIQDSFTAAYGVKEIVKIMLKDSLDTVKKSKKNFINW